MAKIELENKILEFPTEEIKSNPIFLINNFSELTNILNNIKKEFHLKFFYLNRKIIKNILYNADENLKIVKENINDKNLNSFYYLYYIIIDDIYNINYIYDIDVINELYLRMTHEENKLRKFIIYILAFPILYNFEGFNENPTSPEERKIKTIYQNIEEFMPMQQPILDEFDLDLDLTNYSSFNIDEIYAHIILSLIRNKKLENVKYSKNIFEQLDLENIEFSHEIYLQIKNEFDESPDKEYIDCYKITNFENFINKANINFYYILFKYIFKVPLYIYNIQFLLNARKVILEFSKNDFYQILLEIIQLDYKEKIIYVLKVFLDLEFNFLRNNLLIEIVKYFENFLYESREEKIKEIENIMKENHKYDFIKFLSYYPKAKKLNKRYGIIKYIASLNKRKLPKTSKEFEKYIKQWDESEKLINEKKINKIKNKRYLFTYFNDINNRNSLLDIFAKQKIDNFIEKYNDIKNLKVIVNYYELYYFESKEKDITKINDFLTFNTRLRQQDYKRYINDLEIAKEMINKYKLINSITGARKISNSEKELQLNVENWKNIEKMLEENNIDTLDDKNKIGLINFFDNKLNQKEFRHFIKESSFKFLLDEKKKAIEEILKYYKDFFPESRKREIELIETNNIEDKFFDNYSTAKKYNIRKPLILLLLEPEKNITESEITNAVDKWNKIEDEINKKNFKNIIKSDREKIIKFFNEPENEFIYKIFEKKIIEEFVEADEQMSEVSSSSTKSVSEMGKNNKKKKVKKKIKNNSKHQSKLDLIYSKNSSSSKLIDSTYLVTEERKEKNKLEDKSEFLFINILKNDLIFFLNIENGKKNIAIKFKGNHKSHPGKDDFEYCKEKFANNKSSKCYKIFDNLSELVKKLLNEYNNNFLLILEIHIEEKENEFIFSYKFISPLNKETLHFKDFNYLSEGFEYLINEINDEKHKTKEKETKKEQTTNKPEETTKKTDKYNENNVNAKENINRNTDPNVTKAHDLSVTTIEKSYVDPKELENRIKQSNSIKYKIIEFIKEIGDHNNNTNRRHSAEFIKEILKGNDVGYISGGDDKFLKLYEYNFKKKEIEISCKSCCYDICEKLSGKKLVFYACTNQELIQYTYDYNFDSRTGKFQDKYPPIQYDDKNCISVLEIRNREYNENKLILAGQNGVYLFNNPDKEDSRGKKFSRTEGKAYKGLIQIDKEGDLVALTSNEILTGGENKLLIYNINNNEMKCIKQITDYSFIAKTNGMAVIYLDNKQNKKEEEYLICACKKYNDNQKNGILLVNIQNNYNESFFPTKEFEVYCFCPIVGKEKAKSTVIKDINDDIDVNPEGTEFFFAGGFDTNLGQGKIKLFKLTEDKDSQEKKIKFLQDIEIDKYEPKIIKRNNPEEGKADTKGGENQTKTEQTDSEKNNNEYFKGFNGAISSIIQSTKERNILVSCYDGKISLFSKPNLQLYNLKLDY